MIYGFVWKWLVFYKPNGFADHYPYEKWLFHWGYTQHFQTYPNIFSEIPWESPNRSTMRSNWLVVWNSFYFIHFFGEWESFPLTFIFFRGLQLLNMAIESSWIYPARKWWWFSIVFCMWTFTRWWILHWWVTSGFGIYRYPRFQINMTNHPGANEVALRLQWVAQPRPWEAWKAKLGRIKGGRPCVWVLGTFISVCI